MLQPILGRPRLCYALALLATSLLVLAADAEPPLVEASEAMVHEGQRVRMEGLAKEVHLGQSGRASRFTLLDGPSAIPVQMESNGAGGASAAIPFTGGAWVEAEGRLVRRAGRLTLLATEVAEAEGPPVAEPTLGEVAQDPAAWSGRLLRLEGRLEKGELVAPGHRLRLGEGEWPNSGATVAVTGSLAYDPACLCHRLDASEVAAWTP